VADFIGHLLVTVTDEQRKIKCRAAPGELAAEALACAPLALTEPLRELELREVFYGRHFVHDVVASVVQASVPQAKALFMHRFVAEHLVRRHGDHRAHVATIATHWAAAGEPLRAARAYRLAAEPARDATLPALQAELMDDAAVLLADDGSGPTLTLRWHRLQRRPAAALATQCAPFDLDPAELTRLLLQAEAAPP
jgi:hypothetical protein